MRALVQAASSWLVEVLDIVVRALQVLRRNRSRRSQLSRRRRSFGGRPPAIRSSWDTAQNLSRCTVSSDWLA